MTRRIGLTLLGLALAAAVVLTYSNHFDNEFHFDDAHVIEDNTSIRELGNIPEFFTDNTTFSTLPTNRAYRPVLTTTFAVDYWLGDGLDPLVFHVNGLLIHLAVAVLMVLLFTKIMHTAMPHRANAYIAMLLAGWFSLHTANAETINYISARSDSLSTLMVLAALVIYTRAPGHRRHLAYLPLVAGILVKASAVMFVPLLVLYELFFVESVGLRSVLAPANRAVLSRILRRTLAPVVVGTSFFLLSSAMRPGTFDTGGASVWSYLITQPFVVLRYFWTFFVPVDLSADTDWTVLDSIVDARFLIGIAFIAGAVALAVVLSERRETRPIAFGILWFFLALAPTSSFVPLAEVTNDHRMYFPFVGLVLAVGWALALVAARYEEPLLRSSGPRTAVVLSIAVVLAAHALGTWERNQIWDSEETLWLDVTVKSPQNGRGLMNYGLTHMRAGRYEVALDYFERARDTSYGNHPYLFVNTALATEGMGRVDEVESNYLGAVELGPGFPVTNYYYARWLFDEGRVAEAIPYVETALELSASYEPALTLQAEIDTQMQLVSDAETNADADPTAENLVDLSLEYYNAGMYEESIGAAEQALTVDPGSALAYNNVCATYNVLGQYEQAITACTAALELAPEFELARNNLAVAVAGVESGT